jgi:TRAP-type C4-dicarboxylate transport system substrate-binding protein
MVFAEVYTALQTKLVDGQENGLVLIDAAKLYEVQKYCALTGHMWDCFIMIANRAAWDKLPTDLQTAVATHLENGALAQQADMVVLEKRIQADLEGKGMVFNTPDREAFKAVLRKSTFYKELREKYGPEAWGLLEDTVGPLG